MNVDEEDLSREIFPLSHYATNRSRLVNEAFDVLRGQRLESTIPPSLRGIDYNELKALCLDELQKIDTLRIVDIIEGRLSNSSSSTSSSGPPNKNNNYNNNSGINDYRDAPSHSRKRKSSELSEPTIPMSTLKKKIKKSIKNKDKELLDPKKLKKEKKKKKNSKKEKDVEISSEVEEGSSDKEKVKKKSKVKDKSKSKVASTKKSKKVKKAEKLRKKALKAQEAQQKQQQEQGQAARPGALGGERTLMELLELEYRAKAIKALLKFQGFKGSNLDQVFDDSDDNSGQTANPNPNPKSQGQDRDKPQGPQNENSHKSSTSSSLSVLNDSQSSKSKKSKKEPPTQTSPTPVKKPVPRIQEKETFLPSSDIRIKVQNNKPVPSSTIPDTQSQSSKSKLVKTNKSIVKVPQVKSSGQESSSAPGKVKHNGKKEQQNVVSKQRRRTADPEVEDAEVLTLTLTQSDDEDPIVRAHSDHDYDEDDDQGETEREKQEVEDEMDEDEPVTNSLRPRINSTSQTQFDEKHELSIDIDEDDLDYENPDDIDDFPNSPLCSISDSPPTMRRPESPVLASPVPGSPVNSASESDDEDDNDDDKRKYKDNHNSTSPSSSSEDSEPEPPENDDDEEGQDKKQSAVKAHIQELQTNSKNSPTSQSQHSVSKLSDVDSESEGSISEIPEDSKVTQIQSDPQFQVDDVSEEDGEILNENSPQSIPPKSKAQTEISPSPKTPVKVNVSEVSGVDGSGVVTSAAASEESNICAPATSDHSESDTQHTDLTSKKSNSVSKLDSGYSNLENFQITIKNTSNDHDVPKTSSKSKAKLSKPSRNFRGQNRHRGSKKKSKSNNHDSDSDMEQDDTEIEPKALATSSPIRKLKVRSSINIKLKSLSPKKCEPKSASVAAPEKEPEPEPQPEPIVSSEEEGELGNDDDSECESESVSKTATTTTTTSTIRWVERTDKNQIVTNNNCSIKPEDDGQVTLNPSPLKENMNQNQTSEPENKNTQKVKQSSSETSLTPKSPLLSSPSVPAANKEDTTAVKSVSSKSNLLSTSVSDAFEIHSKEPEQAKEQIKIKIHSSSTTLNPTQNPSENKSPAAEEELELDYGDDDDSLNVHHRTHDPVDQQASDYPDEATPVTWYERWYSSKKVQKVVTSTKMYGKVRNKLRTEQKHQKQTKKEEDMKKSKLAAAAAAASKKDKPTTNTSILAKVPTLEDDASDLPPIIGSIEEYEKLFGKNIMDPKLNPTSNTGVVSTSRLTEDKSQADGSQQTPSSSTTASEAGMNEGQAVAIKQPTMLDDDDDEDDDDELWGDILGNS